MFINCAKPNVPLPKPYKSAQLNTRLLSNTCRGNAVPDSAVLVLKVKSIGVHYFDIFEKYIAKVMKCYAPTAIKGLDSNTFLSPGCI